MDQPITESARQAISAATTASGIRISKHANNSITFSGVHVVDTGVRGYRPRLRYRIRATARAALRTWRATSGRC